MEPILRILLGLAVVSLASCRRPPNYSQSNMPVTAFSCRDKIIGGYYADPDTDCQMFHVCVKVPGLGVQDYKFLCPNDTAFDQENQICDDWFNIDCDASTLYYSDNFDLYRIGSDFGGGRKVADGPKLPNININNAVSETQDDDYLQRSDRGENVGSDLLRGSHSSNFFSNRNRGKEDDEDKEEYKKKKPTTPNKSNGVRKLLTGKRLIQSSTTQAPAVPAVSQYSTQAPPQRPNFSGRNRGSSNFNRNFNQQQSTAAPSTTQAVSRATETFNANQRSNFNSQRTYYTQTTPKVEVSTVAAVASSPKNDYYRGNNYNFNNNNNYNYQQQQSTAVPQANYYENTQNYNAQSNFNAQTNYKAPTNYNTQPNYNNYQQQSVAPVVNTAVPSPSSTINPNYETQKLYRLNTAAFNTAPEAKYDENNNGEVLKTAPSQNLGASNFNRVQTAFKNFNASLSTNYNFYSPTTTRPSTYYSPTTSTAKPNFYTNTAIPTTTRLPQQNYYSTTVQPYTTTQSPTTTQKQSPQYNYYTQPTQNYFAQTTLNTQQDFYKQTTAKAVSNYQPPATFKQQYYSTTTTPRYQPINRGTPLPQAALNQYVVSTTDATEKPRPFTTVAPFAQANKSNGSVNDKSATATKEKDQYDYAYYDDSPHVEYESLDNVEFSKTKSG